MILYPLEDDIGSVELLDHMGNDLTVVNAARVSYAKESAEFSGKDEKLISYLLRNRHGTPFEHTLFTFRVKAPLFVVHQWERHRIASYNEESGRYIKMSPEFYAPSPEYAEAARIAYAQYEERLAAGDSKERARILLPLSLYKSYWFTVNSRSLMNFLMTRNEEHAQEEIRAYAGAVESLFQEVMPATWKAWHVHGRIAP